TLPISPSDAQYRSLSDSRAVSVAPSGGLCRSLGRPPSLPRTLPWRLPSRSLGRSHGGCLASGGGGTAPPLGSAILIQTPQN
ncbi:unnamed protein product, partial [Nesidiocoris tenuis]